MREQEQMEVRSATASEWSDFRELARSLGFSELAAAPAAPVARATVFRDWVARGLHAEMVWFARGLEKRLDPRLVLESARSVLVLSSPYNREPCQLAGKKLARYACGDDYHEVLKERLNQLCAAFSAKYPHLEQRAYVDTGPVAERYWAQRAGLGWVGKNGNLISRRDGSYLFLAAILTELVVPYGEPHRDFCGACRACIEACPTQAIVSPGQVDSRRCLSYLTIEQRGPFSERAAQTQQGAETLPTPHPEVFQDWLFGCDICQEVCPWTGKFAAAEHLPAFAPRPAYAELEQEQLAQMEQASFSALFRKSAIKRAKLAGIQRNLAWLKRSAESGEKSG